MTKLEMLLRYGLHEAFVLLYSRVKQVCIAHPEQLADQLKLLREDFHACELELAKFEEQMQEYQGITDSNLSDAG